jgi:DNA-3-methyladenine glycosylase I
MICLEGQQAGLSWITVLKKRENYRQAFHQFDPVRVAAMNEGYRASAPGRRNYSPSRKIQAIIGNARAFHDGRKWRIVSRFVWSFVDNQPRSHAATLAEIPPPHRPPTLSKALKKRGFKFVGSTICYSFMQACGLVNDHRRAASVTREAMMIRKWDAKDPLLTLWLESTIHAHPFIDEATGTRVSPYAMSTCLPPAPGCGKRTRR